MSHESHVAVLLVPDRADGPDLVTLLADQYGISVVATSLLGGEVDRNIRVQAADGSRYLLKVTASNPAEPIDWQEAILEHVARTAPELPVPRLVAARNGTRHIQVTVGDRDVIVRLLTWCEGTMLADIDEPGEALLTQLGEAAGQLTKGLADFPADVMPDAHHWDARSSRDSVDACLPFVTNADDRARVLSIMEMFDEVRPRLEGLPMGVVHQDLNDFNVLAQRDDEGDWQISGILDFGDALYTIRVADVAVAAAYAMLRQPDPIGALCAVVRGFDTVVPLSAAERSVVFPLAAARLCVNATTWTRRTFEADQPYGRDRMRFTWPTIRRITDRDPSEVLGRIDSACAATADLGAQEQRRG